VPTGGLTGGTHSFPRTVLVRTGWCGYLPSLSRRHAPVQCQGARDRAADESVRGRQRRAEVALTANPPACAPAIAGGQLIRQPLGWAVAACLQGRACAARLRPGLSRRQLSANVHASKMRENGPKQTVHDSLVTSPLFSHDFSAVLRPTGSNRCPTAGKVVHRDPALYDKRSMRQRAARPGRPESLPSVRAGVDGGGGRQAQAATARGSGALAEWRGATKCGIRSSSQLGLTGQCVARRRKSWS
jgi:hypothetical protein